MRTIRPATVKECERRQQLAAEAIRKHRRDCAQCNVALTAGRYDRLCNIGWLLAKDERIEHRALVMAERRDAEHRAGQGTLF